MYVGEIETEALFCGAQGIGTAAVGETIVYRRGGGAVCLTLHWEQELQELTTKGD